MFVEVGKFALHLFIGVFVFLAQLLCFVEDVLRRKLFAVLFHAVFGNEQKRLLLHGVVFEELQNALMFVGLKVFARFLELLQKFAVEFRIFLCADGLGLSDEGIHGQILHKEGIFGKDAHKIALLPKPEDLLKAMIFDL